MATEDRLRAITAELHEVSTELAILEEQIAFQAEVSEEARLRALVSETPLADRESAEAGRDLDRMRRIRDELVANIEARRAEQDQLLERMLDEDR